METKNLAELLRETAENHHSYEATHTPHEWSEWYAAYIVARQNGFIPASAKSIAGVYMADNFNVQNTGENTGEGK